MSGPDLDLLGGPSRYPTNWAVSGALERAGTMTSTWHLEGVRDARRSACTVSFPLCMRPRLPVEGGLPRRSPALRAHEIEVLKGWVRRIEGGPRKAPEGLMFNTFVDFQGRQPGV